MDATTYLETFDRTLSKNFHKSLVSETYFHYVLDDRVDINEEVDAVKKALFYGKIKYDGWYPPSGGGHEDQWDRYEPNLVHATLGIDTEAAELLEILLDSPELDKETLRKRVLDEAGDLLWYTALLLKCVGLTFEEVFEKNIAKLKARYPEGFSQDSAVHRNEAKESAVFS